VQTAGGIVTFTIADTVAETTVVNFIDSAGTGLFMPSFSNVVFAPGAPAKAVVTGPSTAVAGSIVTVTFQVKDRNDNVVTNNSTATFSATANGSAKFLDAVGGTLVSGANSGAALVRAANGAVALRVSDALAESVDIHVADSAGLGLNVASTLNIVFTPGQANTIVVQPIANTTTDSATSVTVQVRDTNGNVVPQNFALSISLSAVSGTAKVTGATTGILLSGQNTSFASVQTAAGVAVLTVTDGAPETVQVTVTGTGLNTPAPVSFTVAVGAPARLPCCRSRPERRARP